MHVHPVIGCLCCNCWHSWLDSQPETIETFKIAGEAKEFHDHAMLGKRCDACGVMCMTNPVVQPAALDLIIRYHPLGVGNSTIALN